MNYWIFQVNSKSFLVDKFLRGSDKSIWWRVTRFKNEIKKGDFVFFWQSGDHRGIRAVWRIDEGPCRLPADVHPSEFWVKREWGINSTNLYADCRIIQHFPVIEEGMLLQEVGLSELSILKFRNATNYPVTNAESKLLRSMIKAWTGELNKEIPFGDVSEQNEPAPTIKTVNMKPARIVSSATTLLQCGACGRYVVGSDIERHIRQAHGGQQVEWRETR